MADCTQSSGLIDANGALTDPQLRYGSFSEMVRLHDIASLVTTWFFRVMSLQSRWNALLFRLLATPLPMPQMQRTFSRGGALTLKVPFRTPARLAESSSLLNSRTCLLSGCASLGSGLIGPVDLDNATSETELSHAVWRRADRPVTRDEGPGRGFLGQG